MSLKVKIAMMAINMTCLLFTLLQPSQITPVALIPVIATACLWIFTNDQAACKTRLISYILLVAALIAMMACAIISFCAQISFFSPQDVEIIFNADIFLLGGRLFSYLWFAIIALGVIISLYIGDIIYSTTAIHTHHDRNDSLDDLVHAQID